MANSVKIVELKTCQYGLLHEHAYGANSDHQIYFTNIPTESQFAKFNTTKHSHYSTMVPW